MSWILAIGLALGAFVAMAALFRLPRAAWTSVLAALALGLAGYAAQGNPDMAGSPRSAVIEVSGEGENLVELRRAILPQEQWSQHNALITADALARRDRFADAATMLLGAVRGNPQDGEAWLALANALVAQADGAITPAAQLAYRRAEAAAPESPGVPFFVGIAQLQAGGFADTRGLWAEAAGRAPEGSEARAQIEGRIARLDQLLEQLGAAQEAQQR
jgi:cytochrome c-type biogenesis protein CcmH